MMNAYETLMHLGRQVILAEQVFGEGSGQHQRAVAAWKAQQQKMLSSGKWTF